MPGINSKTYEKAPSHKVAFLGLGVMGYPMAGHLARAGHQVTVYNRTTSKSIAWCAEFSETSRPKHEPTPRLAAQGNFFHGLNPFALLQLFQRDPLLGEIVSSAEISGFWRWNQTPKTYAVCAIKFRRQS